MKFWVIHAQENVPKPRSNTSRREWRSNTLSEYLADGGHEVTRWRSAFSHQAKTMLRETSEREAFENYSIQYVQCPAYKKHIGLSRIRNHRKLASNFTKVVETYEELPDLVHVCNVPIELCYQAVKFGNERSIPVVIDIRDLWPDIYVDFIPDNLRFLRRPALELLNHFSRQLTYAFQNATAITALTESYLRWGLKKANRSRNEMDRIFPMCHQELKTVSSSTEAAALRAKLGLDDDAIIACYVGNIGFRSDFETIIEAAHYLARRQPNLKFVLAGSGPRLEALRDLSKGLSNVILPGWLEAADVHHLMQQSSFGLIAYKCIDNYMLNIPNKFSEYLAGGLALACAIEGEMGKLVKHTQCGFLYEQGNPRSLASQLELVLKHSNKWDSMSAAATLLHRTRFDGAEVFPRFSQYLAELALDTRKAAA